MATKITRVVLYKHGVASFERQAQVENDQVVSLAFKHTEMNDVLKSLTVLDLSGAGTIASISYENNKPIDKRLDECPFSIRNMSSFIDILAELKGVEVTLEVKGQTLQGAIATTSEITANHETHRFISIWSDQTLRFLNLADVSNITVNDPSIQRELTESLNVQRSSKIKDQKQLAVFCKGVGTRQINLSYIIEAPIWKVSYRVIIPADSSSSSDDSDKKSGSTEYLLQGWAIIDNITEEPWENVNLTLVSGQPLSEESDLFNPIYKNQSRALPVPVARAPSHVMSNRGNLVQQQMLVQNFAQNMVSNQMPQQMISLDNYTPQDNTATKELGDLFQYDVIHPVTVRSNQSALVPIVDKKVVAQRVALFNPEKHGKHPNSAVLITNTTGLTLEGGPCTVLEAGTYVGDSSFETIQRGETKFIEYATEQSLEIWAKNSVENSTVSSKIHNGQLCIEQQIRYITTYNLRSKSPKESLVYIEHRFRKDCTLIDTPEPTNPKPINFYIFKTPAAPNTTSLFNVIETRISLSCYGIRDSLTRDKYKEWLTSGYITAAASDSLLACLRLKDMISQNITKISQLEKDIQVIFEKHTRIRSNMSQLGTDDSSKRLRSRYVSELEADENQLAKIQAEIKQLNEEKLSVQEELEAIVGRISVPVTKLG